MDYLQAIGAAVTGGSLIGGVVFGLLAARQKSRVTLLEEMNTDYEKRVKQLEDGRDSDSKEIEQLKKAVDRLENEKRLPLEKLTRLIITQTELLTKQHTENQESIMQLTQAIVASTKLSQKQRGK